MTVEEEPWLIVFEQIIEALEAAVREGVEIIQMSCGGIGDENIEALMPKKRQLQPLDTALHLILRIHIPALAVTIGAAES